MGFLKKIFGNKEHVKHEQKMNIKSFDVTDGLDYIEVRQRENSKEKWMLMVAFANKGDEIALFDVGAEYLKDNGMVQQNYDMAEKYLLLAHEKKINQASVCLGQMWLNRSIDAYEEIGVDTEENRAKADDEFYRRFQLGADYLVEALKGRRVMDTEYVCKIICGTIDCGYNEGKYRDLFMECINKNLPNAIEFIQTLTTSDDIDISSDAWYKLGCFYMYGVYFEDDLEEAKVCFEKCVKICPNNIEGLIKLKNPIFEEE